MPIRDEDGHRAMQAAGKAWNAIKTSGAKTWREWTEVIGPGLVNARAEAQSISIASSGKGYNAAMGALLEEYGLAQLAARKAAKKAAEAAAPAVVKPKPAPAPARSTKIRQRLGTASVSGHADNLLRCMD